MNLPSDFVIRTRRLMGDADFSALEEALEKETPVSIRINQDKCTSVPVDSTPVPWCPEGYYLSITDKAIMLAGNDERGTYYAVRTFMQLFQ